MEGAAAEQIMEPVPRAALECPICLEIPPAEIYLCLNGHSLCVTCSTTSAQCPVCKIQMAGKNRKVRNRFMEELIGCTTIPCKYKQDGCDKLVSRKESKAHFESCEFRPFHLCRKLPSMEFRNCPFGSSKASEIFNHFAEQHIQPGVLTTPNTLISLTNAVDTLKKREFCGTYDYHLFELKSSKGQVAKFLLYYRLAFPGTMVLGRATGALQKGGDCNEVATVTTADVMIENGEYPELGVSFYEN